MHKFSDTQSEEAFSKGKLKKMKPCGSDEDEKKECDLSYRLVILTLLILHTPVVVLLGPLCVYGKEYKMYTLYICVDIYVALHASIITSSSLPSYKVIIILLSSFSEKFSCQFSYC